MFYLIGCFKAFIKNMLHFIINPYNAGGQFGHYKMMQKTWKNDWNPDTWVLI